MEVIIIIITKNQKSEKFQPKIEKIIVIIMKYIISIKTIKIVIIIKKICIKKICSRIKKL